MPCLMVLLYNRRWSGKTTTTHTQAYVKFTSNNSEQNSETEIGYAFSNVIASAVLFFRFRHSKCFVVLPSSWLIKTHKRRAGMHFDIGVNCVTFMISIQIQTLMRNELNYVSKFSNELIVNNMYVKSHPFQNKH